jgi:hypothetical protein
LKSSPCSSSGSSDKDYSLSAIGCGWEDLEAFAV